MSLDGVRLASLGTKFAESRGVTCSSLAVDFVCVRMNGAGRGGSSLLPDRPIRSGKVVLGHFGVGTGCFKVP